MLRFTLGVLALTSVLAAATGSASGSSSAVLPGNGLIAFVDTSTDTPVIGISEADGTHRRRLTPSNPAVWAPAWSPDGRQIAFLRGPSLVLVPASGGRPRVIAASKTPACMEDYGNPIWSSDGRLAFERFDDHAWQHHHDRRERQARSTRNSIPKVSRRRAHMDA